MTIFTGFMPRILLRRPIAWSPLLWIRKAALNNDAGYFAILEGGYNHQVLGKNVLALIQGMSDN